MPLSYFTPLVFVSCKTPCNPQAKYYRTNEEKRTAQPTHKYFGWFVGVEDDFHCNEPHGSHQQKETYRTIRAISRLEEKPEANTRHKDNNEDIL
mmetsp:Transcript_24261/g.35955  ORF Transcript_24261/g.35955 Transcript_24261/m.35955 type:complete len:94 (-) Transcript_24261:659-940(-)